MLIKGDLENLESGEIRVFNYAKLEKELGPFPRYKQYDGAHCEEVQTYEVLDGEEVVETGWQIIGTTRLVEFQWTDPL